MSERHAVFDLLFDWLDNGNDLSGQSAQRLCAILTSISFGHADNWLSPAPAHPDALPGWLLQRSLNAGRSDAIATIDVGAILNVIPFLVVHTMPGDWPQQYRIPILAIRCPPHLFVHAEILRKVPLFAEMLKQAPGWHVAPPTRTSAKLEGTFERAWQWPLTVAVYANAEGRDILAESGPARKMFTLQSHRDVDRAAILIVPGNVANAMRAVSETGAGRYAYVMATEGDGTLSDLAKLRTMAGAAGAASLARSKTLSVPSMEWISLLVEGLARGRPLDEALRRSLPFAETLLFANPKLLARGSPRDVLQRKLNSIGGRDDPGWEAFRKGNIFSPDDPVFAPAAEIRTQLLAALDDEAGPPQNIVDLLASVDFAAFPRILQLPDRVSEMPGLEESPLFEMVQEIPHGHAIPAKKTLASLVPSNAENSRVQAQLISGEANIAVVPPLIGCAVDVWIGGPRDPSGAVADAPFPALPADFPDSAQMTCIFMPLVGCATAERGNAQRHEFVYSKPLFASTPCRFAIRPAPDANQFDARILVMYRNKVVQSLMFSAPVSLRAAAGIRPALTAENIVSRHFAAMPQGRDFDFSFVLNHNAAQQDGITTVGRKSISFQEPDNNFKLALNEITTQLTAINMVGVGSAADVTSQMETSLLALARVGNVLREAITENQPELAEMTSPKRFDPDRPLRLQIVEAKVGAFIPLELFYDYVAPDSAAKLCAKFVAPGFPSSTCGACADRGTTQVICPVGFWGISKVIERRPKAAGLIEDWAQYSIGEPSADKRTLPALNHIVYGISNKVAAGDGGAIAALLALNDPHAKRAGCWKTWREIIVDSAPTMLIVAGHTQSKNAMAELEIGGQFLSLSQIEQTYVMNPGGASPVVLLMGCDTHVTASSIHALSGRFKNKGAAVVVATLAKMRGNQAPACISQLTAAFDAASKATAPEKRNGNSTVGFAILKAKQKLLSTGQSIAMSLTAVGDAEWRL